MNTKAAQTMPELPPSFARVHNDGYWTLRVRDTAEFIVHDSRQTPAQEVYSSDQMRAMYQQGYAAALSQTAGVVENFMTHFCNAIDNLNDMPVSEEWARKWAAKAEFLIGMGPDPGAVSMSDTCDQSLAAAPAASVSERARELVRRWRECAKSAANGPMFDGASEYAVAGTYIACADELESLLSAASDHQQNAAQGGGEK